VQIEQMPDPDSRVTLGRDGDPFGVRRPEVAWRLTSFDARTFARARSSSRPYGAMIWRRPVRSHRYRPMDYPPTWMTRSIRAHDAHVGE
jgi:hypothetical protein